MIPPGEWKWYGQPGHYCLADDCIFHLTTQVGKWLITTVGDLHRRASPPLRKVKPRGCEEVARGRFYETMVFPGENGEQTGSAVDEGAGYETVDEANAGHYRICEEWAKK